MNLLSVLGLTGGVSSAVDMPTSGVHTRSRLLNARRDAVVLATLIAAVLLLVWNGSALFQSLRLAGPDFGREGQIALTAWR